LVVTVGVTLKVFADCQVAPSKLYSAAPAAEAVSVEDWPAHTAAGVVVNERPVSAGSTVTVTVLGEVTVHPPAARDTFNIQVVVVVGDTTVEGLETQFAPSSKL
jgi:hypothetical protein